MTKAALALHGGPRTRQRPFPKGPRFGERELEYLRQALEQNTLFYWHGQQVKSLNREFARMYGAKHCVAVSSGTAAIHVALGACGVTCGDEVITSPITDMGSLIGILYQNAVPVFADLDPDTYTLDPAAVRERITPRTKAILAVHLMGNPSHMDALMELAREHGVFVIEDCAQSYHATYRGRMAGTVGHIGCFSLNDFKQITAGDGGLLITDDDRLYETALRFSDKNYNRLATGSSMRDVPFLAPNYRMNELTGAVGRAQIQRLEGICRRRREIGDRISEAIGDLPGLRPPRVLPDCTCTYWFYMFRVDQTLAGADRDEFSATLDAEGIANEKGYIPSCVYEYDLFRDKSAYPGTGCPFDCQYYGGQARYEAGLCPQAEAILDTAIRIPINEFFTDGDVDDIVAAIRKVSAFYAGR